MPDIKGTLFWLSVVLVLLIVILRGCGSRMDKFREHREQMQEDRKENREKWQQKWQQKWDERRRWRR